MSFSLANAPTHFSHTERAANIAFKSGARGTLDAYIPAHAKPNAPVIVFWYGGGWTEGSKQDYRFVGSALAGRGYLTFVPDYRLYPEARFPEFEQDAAQAVRWVKDHAKDFGANPQRIVLMGHSAGAYIAAMLAMNPKYLEEAGVDIHDVIGFIGLSGPYDIRPNTPELRAIFTAPYRTADWDVTRFVSAIAPPTLLIQGSSDELVSPANSQQLAAALNMVHVPCTLHLYRHQGHAVTVGALSLPLRFRAPTLHDVDAFLDSLP